MLRKIELELSLKPFHNASDGEIRRVGETLFDQYESLLQRAEKHSLLLWVADGSELLDYQGNLDATFEWGKWIGAANYTEGKDDPTPEDQLPFWKKARLYRDDPYAFTYLDLKRIVAGLKTLFQERYSTNLHIGTTFDPGPEFAISDFKYRRHRECCSGFNCFGGKSFVCCYMSLNGDDRKYAEFPDGIPERLSFGTFLGRQAERYCHDLGFDHIWFSNGFGLGMEPWGACGAVFDGKTFTPERCPDIRKIILEFWQDFRKACPELPVELRGTNHSTAMDLAVDGVPLREIYQTNHLTAPPNSPSQALDENYAMEVAGFLSHTAELPANGIIPFRFYMHDPWFLHSAYLQLYGRSLHDMALPLSLASVGSDGRTRPINSLNILGTDNARGELPAQPAREVVAGLHRYLQNLPDAPGPLVWVYPFDEIHDLAAIGERLEEIFAGDYLIRGAINLGLPLNTVISLRSFQQAMRSLSGRILLVSTLATLNQAAMHSLEQFLSNGGKIIFYGPARGKAIERLLGLQEVQALDGELDFSGGKCIHNSRYGAGPLDRGNIDPRNRVAASYRRGNTERPALLFRALPEWHGGCAAWIRGTNSFTMEKHCYQPTELDADTWLFPEKLFLQALEAFSWSLRSEDPFPGGKAPIQTLHLHNNALFLSAHGRSSTALQWLKFPDGAPLFTGTETIIKNGATAYHLTSEVNWEGRVFVSGDMDGRLFCRETGENFTSVHRRLLVGGLQNMQVLFRPEKEYAGRVHFSTDAACAYPLTCPPVYQPELEEDEFGPFYRLKDISGQLLISC
ncbi:MAG: hypothetical protein GX946_05590 [Oligosphaeraceae bacterium]|nr:hypothetical protein [Oligosphaeraceae bacterium]